MTHTYGAPDPFRLCRRDLDRIPRSGRPPCPGQSWQVGEGVSPTRDAGGILSEPRLKHKAPAMFCDALSLRLGNDLRTAPINHCRDQKRTQQGLNCGSTLPAISFHPCPKRPACSLLSWIGTGAWHSQRLRLRFPGHSSQPTRIRLSSITVNQSWNLPRTAALNGARWSPSLKTALGIRCLLLKQRNGCRSCLPIGSLG